MLRAYIGNLDDPCFSWDTPAKGSETNSPRSLGPDFINAREACSLMWEKGREQVYESKDTDWGTSVCRVTKKQLLEFIAELYGTHSVLPWQSEAV